MKFTLIKKSTGRTMGTVIRWGMGGAAIILFLSLLLSGSLLWYKYHDDCAGKRISAYLQNSRDTDGRGFLPPLLSARGFQSSGFGFYLSGKQKTSVSSENRRTVPSRTEPGLSLHGCTFRIRQLIIRLYIRNRTAITWKDL